MGFLAKFLDADFLNVLLRHQLAFLEDRSAQTRRKVNVDFFGINSNGVIVNDFDTLHRLAQGFGPRCDGVFWTLCVRG